MRLHSILLLLFVLFSHSALEAQESPEKHFHIRTDVLSLLGGQAELAFLYRKKDYGFESSYRYRFASPYTLRNAFTNPYSEAGTQIIYFAQDYRHYFPLGTKSELFMGPEVAYTYNRYSKTYHGHVLDLNLKAGVHLPRLADADIFVTAGNSISTYKDRHKFSLKENTIQVMNVNIGFKIGLGF